MSWIISRNMGGRFGIELKLTKDVRISGCGIIFFFRNTFMIRCVAFHHSLATCVFLFLFLIVCLVLTLTLAILLAIANAQK